MLSMEPGQESLHRLGSISGSPDECVSAAILDDTLYLVCGALLYSATPS